MVFNVYFTVKVLVLLLSTSLLFTFSKAHDRFHEHDAHHHSDESLSYKYSEKANAEYLAKTKHNVIHDHDRRENIKQNLNDVWMYAIASTLFISAAPALVLFVIPIDNTAKTQPLLKVLLAFASGGLLGDAFLHLIPHAALAVASEGSHTHHSHSPSHDDTEEHQHDMSVGLGVLAGIITFLIIEKGVRIIKGNSSKHGHSHVIAPSPNDKNDGKKTKLKNKDSTDEDSNFKNISYTKDIKVSGYLNLAADFSHNFTDGLAIGASYLAGNSIGIVTTVTILLHEVPHEIGDFAILLQSGVSRRNAILLQLSTALGALAGTVLSLITKEGVAGFGTNWVLPFTAGGFIYIALVSVIPELLDEEKPTLLQTFLQVIAMFGGVFMMIIIAEYE